MLKVRTVHHASVDDLIKLHKHQENKNIENIKCDVFFGVPHNDDVVEYRKRFIKPTANKETFCNDVR